MYAIPSTKFKNVNRLYPNSTVRGFKQLNYGHQWIDSPNIINNKFNDFDTVFDHLIAIGVVKVQLEVENQYGEIVYPDYLISELV